MDQFKKALLSDKAKSVYASLVCILIGLLIGFIVMIFLSPADAFMEFPSLITGGLSVLPLPKVFFAILAKTAPLICCGLGITLAYKTGIFNIGGAGQYVMGAFGSLLFSLIFHTPWWISVIAGIVFGGLWGVLVSVLKIFFNVSEVLSGIMLNWISLFFVNYSFNTYLYEKSVDISLGNKTFALSEALRIPSIKIGTANLSITIFIALIIAVGVYVMLEKTKMGYELKASGLNKEATRYAGMNEKKNIILTMFLSGALAGLGGALFYVAGVEQWNVGDSSALPGMAWNGIVVAFIGQINPIGVVFASLFTSFLSSGGNYLTQSIYPAEISSLITGIIVYSSGLFALIKILLEKYVFSKKQSIVETDANAESAAEEKKGEVE